MVAPQETSRLEWARIIELAGVGHITILQTAETFEKVLAELREAGIKAGR
jgi:hypothetical protein